MCEVGSRVNGRMALVLVGQRLTVAETVFWSGVI
jgi:hypothetical protein